MITLPTTDPQALWAAMRRAIDERRIRTWAYDAEQDLTHTADQWNQAAWLRAAFTDDALLFNIIQPRGVHLSRTVYAVYHGRLIESVLAHFDKRLSGDPSASAFPAGADVVGDQSSSDRA